MLLSLSGHTLLLWNPVGFAVEYVFYYIIIFTHNTTDYLKRKCFAKLLVMSEKPKDQSYLSIYVLLNSSKLKLILTLQIFEAQYTQHLLVFTIIITYSTLAPFILLFGIVYFALAFVSQKYSIFIKEK